MAHGTRSGGHAEACGEEDTMGGCARRRGGTGSSLPGLVLCVAVGLAGLQGAAAAVSDTWDAKRTTRLNTGHENGVIVRGAGSESTLRIGGSFRFNDCPSDGCSFRCVFVHASGNQMSSRAKHDSMVATEIACNTTKVWGSSYDAGSVELKVQKATAVGADWTTSASDADWTTLAITGMVGETFTLFLEEDIFSVQPTIINAYATTVTVVGSGFAPGTEYRCITFEGPSSDTWMSTRTKGFTGLVGFPFVLVNRTMGTCRIQTAFSARATKLSIMNKKTCIDNLDAVNGDRSAGYQLMQPAVSRIQKPSGGGNDIIFWKGLAVTWYESWTFTSMQSGLKTGSETMTISGAGFKRTESYFCDFTLNTAANTGCTGEVTLSNVVETVQATMVSPLRLTCITPVWTGNEAIVKTIFTVRGADVLPENNVQATSFDFVSKPVWQDPTPAEGAVFVEGVDCANLNLRFKASGGMSTLRLTLDYTPLRPRPAMDFLQWDSSVPTEPAVLFKTNGLTTTYFNDAAAVDDIRSFGYCLGPAEYTLRLPKNQPAESKTQEYVVYNKGAQAFEYTRDGLGIVDNVGQPSNLTFTTKTLGDEVTGTLFWNVSRGWEGYGYKLCVTARHAAVNYSVVTSDSFAKRCIYVVVPKCQKCYGPSEDLSAIASRYGAHWLDLWSVNRNLVNTTAVQLASDEVFNTKNDQLYPLVAARQNIRLGVAYLLRATDTLEGVGKRFGMSMRNLMQLNPDIVVANLVHSPSDTRPS